MTKISIEMKNMVDFQKFSQIAVNSEYPITIKSGTAVVDARSLLGIFTIDWTKPVDVEFDSEDIKTREFLKAFES